jgi:predicted RNase H-like nuclease
MRVLDVDACSIGWVSIELRCGTFAAAHIADCLTTLLSAVGNIHGNIHEVHAVGIDMPLGLVETGWRQADLAAHAFVGARRSSVFRVPPRAVWKEEVWHQVSFAAMNDRPLTHRKISWTGQVARRALLAGHGIHLPDQLGAAGTAGTDDVLDAAAAAWSAHRIATGHASRLPTEALPGQKHISIQY